MENDPENVTSDNDQMQLPPGFRFYPTDEELITNYLSKKVMNSHFSAVAITEVDMNRVEPWDLPWKAKVGENEWYFFCVKDKKYPNGLRTNRATASGYWKATGKDKEIFRGKSLVGMKKTLVFHKGRAPKGVKSNWVSHEYRLEGEYSYGNHHTKSDWVIMKVFHKSCSGKKVDISGLTRPDHELVSSTRVKKPGELGSSHVSCFSSLMIPTDAEIYDDFAEGFNIPISPHASYQMGSFKIGSFGQFEIRRASLDDKDTVLSSIEISSVVSNGKTWEKSKEEQDDRPSSSAGVHDFDCIWNF